MKGNRNRLTPFLVIILLVLIWILISIIIFKLMENGTIGNTKKLKLDDDLVQELYSYITLDDVKIYSSKDYDINTLPDTYIVSKASRFMTIEDIELLNNNRFVISSNSLDNFIKTAFGPDIKYDLKDIKGKVESNLELNENKLLLDMTYDKINNNYVGYYKEIKYENEVLVKKELVQATKTDTVNLKINYVFYKKNNNKYDICKDAECNKILESIDNIDDYQLKDSMIVSFSKASDEVYYYQKNS